MYLDEFCDKVITELYCLCSLSSSERERESSFGMSAKANLGIENNVVGGIADGRGTASSKRNPLIINYVKRPFS